MREMVAIASWSFLFGADSEVLRKPDKKKLIDEGMASASAEFIQSPSQLQSDL